MSYQFCLGASGAGKSTQLHRWVIRKAQEALGRLDFTRNYMIVVPDQYTMQTQKELVLAAGDAAGIMNVDVLSFGRLSHRIFEEVGEDRRPVLDDMGKNLVLRRLVTACRKDLKVLDRQIDRLGMITEVKSAISEFMQYGIGVEDVGNLAAYAAAHGQGGLALRLQDLQTLYAAFLEAGRDENGESGAGAKAGRGENGESGAGAGARQEENGESEAGAKTGRRTNADHAATEKRECQDRSDSAFSKKTGSHVLVRPFITGEETLDVLAEKIPESRLVKESVIVFDGFTGFTPVQYRVLRALMQNARKVIFAFDYGEDGGTSLANVVNGAPFEAQDLFYLTRKTVNDIAHMAARDGVPREADWIVGGDEKVLQREADRVVREEEKVLQREADRIVGRGERAAQREADWIVGSEETVLQQEMDRVVGEDESEKHHEKKQGARKEGAPGGMSVPARFRGNPSLAHLERSLFRYPVRAFYPQAAFMADRVTSSHDRTSVESGGGSSSENIVNAGHSAGSGSAIINAGHSAGRGSAIANAGHSAGSGSAIANAGHSAGSGSAIANAGHSVGAGSALSVHLAVCSNPEQEVRQMCIRIRRLMQEKGYQYRDFGVVTGDLAGYEDAVRLYAGRYGIPVYVDTNRAVLQNPLTETIRAALEISAGDYRYETVFRFLRSGLSGLSSDEIDRLENYCLARGIRSRKRWETAFDEEFEKMREHFLGIIRPLQDISSERSEAEEISSNRNKTGEGTLSDANEAGKGTFSAENEAGEWTLPDGNEAGGRTLPEKNEREKGTFSDENKTGEGIPSEENEAGGENFSGRTERGKRGKVSAAARTRALYDFLVGIHAGEQMQALSEQYEAAGDTAHAMEYGQIYGAVIHLLDELYELLGEETVSADEFQELAEAGFEEIRLGVLPQQVDRVLVGDIERTRMPEVRVLFFLGVNDGNIPKATSKGGLISDLDREFLQESDVLRDSGGELAPTPRQQMYIQRLYLYMNMTKPSDALYVSYVRTAGDGSSVRPSYLIGTLQQIFPSLKESIPEEDPLSAQMVCPQDAASFLSAGLRDYADGMYLHAAEHPELHLSEQLLEFETVYGYCAQAEETVNPAETGRGEASDGVGETVNPVNAGSGERDDGAGETVNPVEAGNGETDDGAGRSNAAKRRGICVADDSLAAAGKRKALREVTRQLRDAAFQRYQPAPISKETARRLYGRVIRGSVTRLEAAAQCYLRQYLQYGLRLTERKEYTFEPNDSGTILHESVQRFGQLLKENGIGWTAYSAEQGHALVRRALQESAGEYNDQVLYATERTAYQTNRLLRTLERTVDTLQFQLQQGDFLPAALEEPFGEHGELQFNLEDGGRLQLIGRIDRVDLALEESGRKPAAGAEPERESGGVPAAGAEPDIAAAEYAGKIKKIYLKILDYKSGSRDLDPKMMRAGIQLQLLLYLCAEEQRLRRRWPDAEIIPSAMLYYHFDDPMLGLKEADKIFAEEILNGEEAAAALELQTIRQKLRPKGMVGSEEDILGHLDHSLGGSGISGAPAAGRMEDFSAGHLPGGTSLVVPVKKLRNGSLGAGSRVFSQEEFRQMEEDLKAKVCELACHILGGDIQADPAVLRPNVTACTYCPYKNVCGFDLRIPGYEYREIR